jgi:hypothetical protein
LKKIKGRKKNNQYAFFLNKQLFFSSFLFHDRIKSRRFVFKYNHCNTTSFYLPFTQKKKFGVCPFSIYWHNEKRFSPIRLKSTLLDEDVIDVSVLSRFFSPRGQKLFPGGGRTDFRGGKKRHAPPPHWIKHWLTYGLLELNFTSKEIVSFQYSQTKEYIH